MYRPQAPRSHLSDELGILPFLSRATGRPPPASPSLRHSAIGVSGPWDWGLVGARARGCPLVYTLSESVSPRAAVPTEAPRVVSVDTSEVAQAAL